MMTLFFLCRVSVSLLLLNDSDEIFDVNDRGADIPGSLFPLTKR
jgi:hypothetical protein